MTLALNSNGFGAASAQIASVNRSKNALMEQSSPHRSKALVKNERNVQVSIVPRPTATKALCQRLPVWRKNSHGEFDPVWAVANNSGSITPRQHASFDSLEFWYSVHRGEGFRISSAKGAMGSVLPSWR